jgi:hypothetical protein
MSTGTPSSMAHTAVTPLGKAAYVRRNRAVFGVAESTVTMPGTVGAIRRNAVRIAECIGRFAKRNVTGFAIRLTAGAIRPESAVGVA